MKILIIFLLITGITACKQKISEPSVTGKAKAMKDTVLSALQPIAESEGTDVAKVQFLEDWYFDPETFNLYKKVKYIMLAYEILDNKGKVRNYKAGFYVPFGVE